MSKTKKSVAWFLVLLAIIGLLTYTAFWGLKIGSFAIPSVFDKENGIKLGLDLTGGSAIVYEAQVDGTPTDSEMETAVGMLQTRLDGMGYTEATVTRQGEKRIRCEIPSVANPEDAVAQLGQTAHLTFQDMDGNVLVDGNEVKNAVAEYGALDSNGLSQNYVKLEFTDAGRQAFKEATAKIAALKSVKETDADGNETTVSKNYLSIALDANIISSPMVNEEIDSDSAIISGSFDATSAKDLASLIRSGKLPFALKDVELTAIGPTLGEKALQTSLWAGAIGIGLVLLYMLIMYRMLGLIADIALVCYTSLTLIIMTLLHINLSLPGIAGIVLSIGMAVDANVIIFERIKEEVKSGKSFGSSITLGFKRAFSAIFDGNVTTLIAAAVLLWLGTGTIQGFAQTLGLGVIISMFTAIIVTRWLLNLFVGMNFKNTKLYVSTGGQDNA
ncbi:MAG: protein translocase subunit SecD [Clostridiales bacterium]|jgi:protein-export membrane protein SecD|nr:protein translocase subunit SecD [Clostridiales bacterium]